MLDPKKDRIYWGAEDEYSWKAFYTVWGFGGLVVFFFVFFKFDFMFQALEKSLLLATVK